MNNMSLISDKKLEVLKNMYLDIFSVQTDVLEKIKDMQLKMEAMYMELTSSDGEEKTTL
ncbi:MAG: hypothetical protein FWE02_06250 [Defluviitaleaceae bacterium]|nr:hypothetical protein [Defluviitaleaceae bacterium]